MSASISNLALSVFDHARQAPERAALVVGDGVAATTVTYRAFAGAVAAAMDAMTEGGIADQPYVAMRIADPVADLVHFTALTALGVGIYPMSSGSAVEQEVLSRLGISVLVSDDPRPLTSARLFFADPGRPSAHRSAEWPVLKDIGERPWLVRSSSGTTGVPKIFVTRQCDGAFRRQRYFDATGVGGSRFLSLTPTRFGAARQRVFYRLGAGQSVHLPAAGAGLAAIVRHINAERIATLYAVPMHLMQLLELAPETRLLFPHAPTLEASSSTIDAALAQEVRARLTPNLVNSYSVSEVGHVSAARDGTPVDGGSDIGTVLPGVEVAILDEDGRRLPSGETGHIAVRFAGRDLAVGYLEADGTWRSGVRDGWFLPGDLGRLSTDGRLGFAGRSDDMIIFNGINIFPGEIESAAKRCNGILDACAFGVPNRLHQQVPCVAVIGDDGFSQDSFMKEMRRRLGNRAPQRCVVVEAFPRNAMGKLLRRELVRQLTEHGSPALDLRFTGEWRIAITLSPVTSLPAYFHDWAMPLVGAEGWAVSIEPGRVPGLQGLTPDENVQLSAVEHVARTLLNQARVPVFDRFVAVEARPATGDAAGLKVTWRVPAEPFVPSSVYASAMKVASEIVRRIVGTVPTSARIAAEQDRVEQAIARLRAFVPGGKSTIPVLESAHRLGIPYFHIGLGAYQLGWGSKSRRLDRSSLGGDSALGAKLVGDKATAAGLLRMAGLPAPLHECVSTPEQALAAARRIAYPVVVKPADCERGEGVAIDIMDDEALVRSFKVAVESSRSKRVLVEKQVAGVCHRLVVQDGRLLYAVQRGPMSVTGDGIRTVRELVDDIVAQEAGWPRWRRSGLLPLDALAEAELRRNGLVPLDVPDPGRIVPLRRVESTEWGGVDVDVTHAVHPDNLEIASVAARLFSLQVAGIDLITPDIARPWHANGAIINEVNYAPQLGGAEISRSYLPTFLSRLMGPEGGRIPLLHAPDIDHARRLQDRFANDGLRAWMTDGTRTWDPQGSPCAMPMTGVRARAQALLCRADVDALVIVETC